MNNIGQRQHVNCLSLYGRLLTGDSQDVFAMDEWSDVMLSLGPNVGMQPA